MFTWAFCSLICYAGAFYFVALGGGYKGDAVVLGGADDVGMGGSGERGFVCVCM